VRTVIVLVAAAAMVLTGCGPESEVESMSTATGSPDAGAGATSTPEGRISDLPPATSAPESSERGVSGRAQVEVPEGWTEARVDDVFDVRYTAGTGEKDPLLSLAGDFGRFRMSRSAASVLISQIQMGTPGFTIHSQEDIEVEGASNAVRVDFSWGTAEDGGVFDGMWVMAVDTADGYTVGLALSGGEGELDEDDFDRAAESFRMLPADG
jgi:hypothetical protein